MNFLAFTEIVRIPLTGGGGGRGGADERALQDPPRYTPAFTMWPLSDQYFPMTVYSSLQKLCGEWVQASGAVIPGNVWLDKC